MWLLDAYRRFRHTFGFGVHSALAFRVVTEVWRLKGYGYYGYEAIEEYLDAQSEEGDERQASPGRLRREARLVLRLAAAFGVMRAWLGRNVPEICAVALREACSGMEILDDPLPGGSPMLGVMELGRGEKMDECLLRKAGDLLGQGGTILLINGADGDDGRKVFSRLGEGLWLSGRHTQLFFSREGMPKISYTLLE